jgi:Zn-dependent protease with chaperone function
MTPDTNLAVFERKGAERCLLIGAGVLERMPIDAFKAILAHEYGHFSNRDTAGGGFALSVRRSLLHLIIGMARTGNATPWNPVWWFASGFYRLFLRISQGASRLQEILADRRAADVYGGAAFARGLKHVVACSLTFDEHVNATIRRALEAKEPLRGLWSPPETITPAVDPDGDSEAAPAKSVAEQLAEALARAPSPYDSHPAPNDRIRWVEQVTGKAQLATDASETAWSLFSDRDKQEREMTLFVYARLAEQGVRLPALPKA